MTYPLNINELGQRVDALAPRVLAAVRSVQTEVVGLGVDPVDVRIVAVTKGFGPEAPLAAARCGLLDVGENFADELVAKALACAPHSPDLRWHFLGALQTNKINRLAPHVHVWHTLDTTRRCAALADRVPGAAVFVQVNLTGANGRGGCAPDEVVRIVQVARELGLAVRGLMGVGPDPSADPRGSDAGDVASRASFELLATLARACGVPELSAGMSDDFGHAVAAGARTVRLGSVLFGPRTTA